MPPKPEQVIHIETLDAGTTVDENVLKRLAKKGKEKLYGRSPAAAALGALDLRNQIEQMQQDMLTSGRGMLTVGYGGTGGASSPDMADAMSMMFMPTADVRVARLAAQENMRRAMMERERHEWEMRERERSRRGRGGIRVEVHDRPDMMAQTMHVRIENLKCATHLHDNALATDAADDYIRQIAREQANMLAREIEAQIVEQMQGIVAHNRRGRINLGAGAINYVRDRALHMGDLAYGFAADYTKRDDNVIAAVADLPMLIEEDMAGTPCKAELLATPNRLFQESQDMSNCVYRTYGPRVENGEYILYHITAKDFKASGYTVGFSKNSKGQWIMAQVKGNKNSELKDRKDIIRGFMGVIQVRINEAKQGAQNVEKQKTTA